MFVAMRDGLFKSADAGASWKSVGNDLKNLAAVTINPKKPNEIYLSTIDGRIYVSADGGKKWRRWLRKIPLEPESKLRMDRPPARCKGVDGLRERLAWLFAVGLRFSFLPRSH